MKTLFLKIFVYFINYILKPKKVRYFAQLTVLLVENEKNEGRNRKGIGETEEKFRGKGTFMNSCI